MSLLTGSDTVCSRRPRMTTPRATPRSTRRLLGSFSRPATSPARVLVFWEHFCRLTGALICSRTGQNSGKVMARMRKARILASPATTWLECNVHGDACWQPLMRGDGRDTLVGRVKAVSLWPSGDPKI